MKGVVFTEFLEMVEEVYSPEIADRIITRVDPECGGAYTSVGTYPYEEMVGLIQELSKEVGRDVPQILRSFGRQLFSGFQRKFPELFVDAPDAFGFLEKVEGIIHVEVRKLYPDAELPRFEMERPEPDVMVMVYNSPRAMSDFGAGLMQGCFDHFGEEVAIETADLSDGKGTRVRFRLQRQPQRQQA